MLVRIDGKLGGVLLHEKWTGAGVDDARIILEAGVVVR